MLLEALKKIGLSDKEAKVYLASLQVGNQPVSVVAKKADINRSTTYLILEELKRKGLVSQFTKNDIKFFNVIDPEKLINYIDRTKTELENNKSEIKNLLPQFNNLINPTSGKPKVTFFEGLEGIKSVYNNMFNSGTKEIFSYASTKYILKYLPENGELFKKEIKARNIILKEISEKSKESISYAKTPINKHHEVRFIPPALKYSIDYLIYNDVVAMISFKEPLIAVVIENEAIAESQKSIFKLSWPSTKSLKKII